MVREMRRIAAAGHDVAEDPQAGDAGDVADDERELDVHLDQRLLHALHERARAFDERGAVSKIAAQRDDPIRGTEAPAQQAEDVEVAEPFAVGNVTLAAWKILDVACVDK